MKVYKFGGASIKSADAIRNMSGIIKNAPDNRLLVVVSAMGKITNALENLLIIHRGGKDYQEKLTEIKQYHLEIMDALFKMENPIFEQIRRRFVELEYHLLQDYPVNVHYDQVISFGEIFSSMIVHAYLVQELKATEWIDARKYILTDNTFKEGKILWDYSFEKINAELPEILDKSIILTQGFIGGHNNLTTTLGREGSDFSAAIFASALGAESLTIWKDVPGILNADPSRFDNAILYDELSYQEAAEMTYYGATVIHPKTIKPLANKGIPLLVKSFDNPSAKGTIIHTQNIKKLAPAIIIKERQSLVSLTIKDFSFINEENLKLIFHELSLLNVKINMMQNSALTFKICVDYNESKIDSLKERLSNYFNFQEQHGLMLLTIKNYTPESLEEHRKGGTIELEQKTALNYQALIALPS
ncbi:MAG: aspartate kinase [Candidatus Cyclobacteriaceae bacterium M2_1C_046]